MTTHHRTWTWRAHHDVRGLILDMDGAVLHWFDAVSNLCGDDGSALEQSLADYRARGVPSIMAPVPDDVQRELDVALRLIV